MTKPAKLNLAAVPLPDDRPKPKILVVDDDERNLLALTEVLTTLAEVVTVSSGREALRALMRGDFAVILLDVFMPDMDGYETAGFIREREQTSRIPIIFLSAVNKETEHLMRGYAMGAVDYVFKPVDPLILRSKAAVFVDLYRLRTEVETRIRAEQELEAAKLRAEQQRIEMERELQATRLRQAAILNSLPVVLFEASYSESEGLRRRLVGGSEQSIGEDAAAWIGADGAQWEAHIVPEDVGAVDREYSAKRAAGDRASVRYRWIGDSGTSHHFLEQAVRIADDVWIGSITDVTAQSKLENQLMQAQKLDAIGQLTGGVAHDFNNVLAAILGGIELLPRRGELTPSAMQILERMRQAADQGVALVTSLLSFARKQPLRPVPVDPGDLRQSVTALAEHALGSNFRLEWQTDCGHCQFFADSSQLTLAILNLIINARDAMPDGGTIEVVVEREQDLAPLSGMLRIAVSDRGPGIPPELVAKITEPFFTTKPAGKGTGLGLSMVVTFVEQSGGTLNFTTPPNGGTCVEIRLPIARVTSPSTELSESLGEVARGHRTILLVDDDEVVRATLCELLTDLGSAVTPAEDGKAALDELQKPGKRFDLVLSDISMPRMDGVELASAMERQSVAVPIVMMTGDPNAPLCAKLPKRLKVLPKPLTSSDLETLLASL